MRLHRTEAIPKSSGRFFPALGRLAIVAGLISSTIWGQGTLLAQKAGTKDAVDQTAPLPRQPQLLQQAPKATDAAPAAASESPELAAIRAESSKFMDAFNQRDAKGVAALWTADGEYRDEDGVAYVGREAIEKAYADYFSSSPPAKIRVVIDSLRMLGDHTAIEDGRAMLDPPPAGAPAISKYTAIHVLDGGQWRMASVRDARVELPSSYRHVADLDWLIGTWTAEEHGAKYVSVCQWIANKSFVERHHSVQRPDGTMSSGVQLIGWNPQAGHVQSWDFDSDGGHSVGVWSPRANGWSAEVRGVLGDGTPTHAVNHLRRLDDNAYAWKSVDRTIGGVQIPETDEVVIKRQAEVE